tara:strand:- start:10234 stop:11199 length:966 start_codon:yes stop_codon:yes gene_type:complete
VKNKSAILLIVLFICLLVVKQSFYILTEAEQAIITQFGRPVSKNITGAGMHFKLPWQTVIVRDKRILTWNGNPNQIPTKDKKYIKVDTTARWKIVDVLKFIQTVRNETGAASRLDTILDGVTRDIISNHNLVEAVRNSNAIIDSIKKMQEEVQKLRAQGEAVVEEEFSGEIEEIEVGREQLSSMIVDRAEPELQELGIQLIDVQLRRISYEESVEQKVYDRMISERKRIAQKIRSIGKGEKAQIEGRLEKDKVEIESQAYKEAQQIRGEAEARSFKIYADALGSDQKFYDFIRSMEAYKKAIKPDSKLLLSSDSDFLKFLK